MSYTAYDLCLPFDAPFVRVQYAPVKLEHDLSLPFADLRGNFKKPKRFVKAGKRQQDHRRLLAKRAPSRNPRSTAFSAPAPTPTNRNFRPKANVLIDVDCSRSNALQRALYLESKRQVLAKWSGSNQWLQPPTAPLCRRPPLMHDAAGTCITEWGGGGQGGDGAPCCCCATQGQGCGL